MAELCLKWSITLAKLILAMCICTFHASFTFSIYKLRAQPSFIIFFSSTVASFSFTVIWTFIDSWSIAARWVAIFLWLFGSFILLRYIIWFIFLIVFVFGGSFIIFLTTPAAFLLITLDWLILMVIFWIGIWSNARHISLHFLFEFASWGVLGDCGLELMLNCSRFRILHNWIISLIIAKCINISTSHKNENSF